MWHSIENKIKMKNNRKIERKYAKSLAILLIAAGFFSCNTQSSFVEPEEIVTPAGETPQEEEETPQEGEPTPPEWDDDTYLVSDILYPKNAKLKQISHVESIKSIQGGMIITQYEYDEQGRISKVSRPMYEEGTFKYEKGTIVGLISYSEYVYNDTGLLETIIYYHFSLYVGLENLQTYTYSYDENGNKIKEVIEYPQITQDRKDITLYYYDNDRLKREEIYNGGVFDKGLITYIEYEYDDQGRLVSETSYLAKNNTFYSINKHSYQNDINVKTEVFNSNNQKTRVIRRYYDANDNLIYLASYELSPYMSPVRSVTIYEYY